jgi:hypothetical protein
MLAKDVRKYIIVPTLQITGLHSDSAEILIYGTGYVETGYDYLVQMGNPKNGGIGFWQDEPSDFNDIVTWLKNGFNKTMMDRVLSACYYTIMPSDPMALASNLKLAVMFCRLHYYRVKQALPEPTDAAGMAQYHKKWYNSSLGAADVDKNTEIFQKIVNGEL